MAKRFPLTAFWLADRLAAIGYRCFHGYRKRSLSNIRIAFGDHLAPSAIESTARRSLRNFFRACVEVAGAVDAAEAEIKARIAIAGLGNLDAALAKGHGVVLLSAHLGNFFLLGSRLTVEGYPTAVLINQPRDRGLAELLDGYRLRVWQRTIHARPRREALRELGAILRQNQVAVVIADEFRHGNGIAVRFFGGTVIARRGPVTIALRTGAAIVPAYLVRQGDDSLKLIIEPELVLERGGKGSAAISENTARLVQWLERTVRAYPEQWNWMNVRHWAEPGATTTAKIDESQPLQRAV